MVLNKIITGDWINTIYLMIFMCFFAVVIFYSMDLICLRCYNVILYIYLYYKTKYRLKKELSKELIRLLKEKGKISEKQIYQRTTIIDWHFHYDVGEVKKEVLDYAFEYLKTRPYVITTCENNEYIYEYLPL